MSSQPQACASNGLDTPIQNWAGLLCRRAGHVPLHRDLEEDSAMLLTPSTVYCYPRPFAATIYSTDPISSFWVGTARRGGGPVICPKGVT
jgi:hypothetical protein